MAQHHQDSLTTTSTPASSSSSSCTTHSQTVSWQDLVTDTQLYRHKTPETFFNIFNQLKTDSEGFFQSNHHQMLVNTVEMNNLPALQALLEMYPTQEERKQACIESGAFALADKYNLATIALERNALLGAIGLADSSGQFPRTPQVNRELSLYTTILSGPLFSFLARFLSKTVEQPLTRPAPEIDTTQEKPSAPVVFKPTFREPPPPKQKKTKLVKKPGSLFAVYATDSDSDSECGPSTRFSL